MRGLNTLGLPSAGCLCGIVLRRCYGLVFVGRSNGLIAGGNG